MKQINILEALLYAAGDEGLSQKQLTQILELTPESLSQLVDSYEARGLTIQQYGDTYVLTTPKEAAQYIEQLVEQE